MAKGYYEMQMPDGEKYSPIQGYTWAVGNDNYEDAYKWFKFLEISAVNIWDNLHFLLLVQFSYRAKAWGIFRINVRVDNGTFPDDGLWDFSWLMMTHDDGVDAFQKNIINAVISGDRKKISFYARSNPIQYGRTCFTVLYSSTLNGTPITTFNDWCISSKTPEETEPSEMTGVSLVKEPSITYQSEVSNNTLILNM